ncbi:MAG TPA: CARDB domain-containing protein, partial [Thermoanaerobaculaceae bacterium]|nr:CARDB domain-containing protein [Thermoanaerobaculaceae bacterium]
VTWQGGPDLAVTMFTPPVLKSAPGNPFVVYETTANLGNLPAGASVTRYYLSPAWPVDPATAAVVGQRAVPALPPGQDSHVEALQFTVPGGLQPGLYNLAACADADHAVIETNE